MLVMIITSFSSHAHLPDLSTAVLSKTDTGKFILQITSSLLAFEGEIDYLYSKADEALYKAKRNGRNKIEVEN